MADEITLNLRLQLANGVLAEDFNPGRIQVDQTTQTIFKRVIVVGTTEESVTFTDVTTPGICYIYNLDTTNYVQWGKTTTDYVGRLLPADIPGILRLDNGATEIFLKANTAQCRVLLAVLDL